MIFWPLVAALVLAAALSYPLVIRPQLDHRHHVRALAHIAQLERELGYDVPLEQRIDRELAATNLTWYDGAIAKTPNSKDPPEPSQRIYGECAVCGHHVAVNAGMCRGTTTKGKAVCAKIEWRRSQR